MLDQCSLPELTPCLSAFAKVPMFTVPPCLPDPFETLFVVYQYVPPSPPPPSLSPTWNFTPFHGDEVTRFSFLCWHIFILLCPFHLRGPFITAPSPPPIFAQLPGGIGRYQTDFPDSWFPPPLCFCLNPVFRAAPLFPPSRFLKLNYDILARLDTHPPVIFLFRNHVPVPRQDGPTDTFSYFAVFPQTMVRYGVPEMNSNIPHHHSLA